MKKIILIGLLLVFYLNTYACDICGCSSGNYFIGPFPQFKKHFIGTRYSYRSYSTVLASDATQFSHDFYQTVELWSGLNLGKKWQAMLFIPYNINSQSSDDGYSHQSGMGDITILSNYSLFNLNSINISHQLWIGGGIKLPTGKHAIDPADPVASGNLQPGTGSVDFILNSSYALHIINWGINSNINYKINLINDHVQFGNHLFISTYAYRSLTIAKTTYNPNIGLIFENMAPTKQNEANIADTGGSAILFAAGLETYINKLTIGINAQLPLIQNLSNNRTTAKSRGLIHVTYTF